MQYILCILVLVISGYFIREISKKKCGAVCWIYYELIYNCFIKFIMGMLGLPALFNYVTDLILIIIIMHYVFEKQKGFKREIPGSLQLVFILYCIVIVFSYVLNIYSPLLLLWGVRNNLRFLIFAMMCAVYMKREDIYNMLDILFYYFWLNIITVTYEFFFAGFRYRTGDYVSGLYSEGKIVGGNGALNVFLCIICIVAIVRYLNHEKKAGYLLTCVGGSLYMAALSELKVFFVEIVLIALLAICFTRKTTRTVYFVLVGILGLVIGVQLMYQFFPQYNDFFAVENLGEALFSQGNYAGEESMSRTGAIPYVFEHFLTTWPEKLFGIGFGNADYSKFSFLTSDFYRQYHETVYQWFYAPFILIETGILGLLAYGNILLNFYKKSLNAIRKTGERSSLLSISMITVIVAVILLVYNQSLKLESSGYLVYFFMAIPYILKNGVYDEAYIEEIQDSDEGELKIEMEID